MTKPEYKTIMDIFYSRIADFISSDPQIMDELEYEESLLKGLNMFDEDRKYMVLDWYIFDHKSRVLKKIFLDHFIDAADLDIETRKLYMGFRKSIYSLFEVKAIRTGKEMIARDILSGKEYNIKDTTLTQSIRKSQLAIMRVLNFMDIYIIAGKAFVFPLEGSRYLKLSLFNARDTKKPFRLTPLIIHKIFYTQDMPEKLPPQERFRLICNECGLADKYINEIIDRTKARVKGKGTFTDIQQEFMSKLLPHAHFDATEITKAYVAVWNSFIEGHTEKGPIEESLIWAAFTYLRQKVNPNRFRDHKKASKKADMIFAEWLDLRHDELDGRSPRELILKEREELGNPEHRIKFHIEITGLTPGAEKIRDAEDSVNTANLRLKENKVNEAIKLYKAHLVICPKNHVAWLNMGVAYMLIQDREKGMRCFKKALEIKPNYKMAAKNLAILENASDEDIKRMSDKHRVMIANNGRRRILDIQKMQNDIFE